MVSEEGFKKVHNECAKMILPVRKKEDPWLDKCKESWEAVTTLLIITGYIFKLRD